MDKEQAIYNFWSGFGVNAYEENTVPDDAIMPYITYAPQTGSIDDVIMLTGSLWYHSTSWKDVSRKAEEIAQAVGDGYYINKVDGGYLWITPGSPFSQHMSDPSDDMIRRIYINLNAEFLTAY